MTKAFVGMAVIMIAVLSQAPLLATTPPESGNFPAGFWSDVLSGRDSVRYGDPGWVKRAARRRATREQIAAGRTTLAALEQAQFVLPVLLGRYKNATTTYDTTDFRVLLFSDQNSTGSLNKYYDEVSYGQFQLTGKVYGWFEVDNPQSYYNGGDNGMGSDFPTNSAGFVREVVAAADDSVDFSQYDNDGPDGKPNSGDDDGYVDGVYVIYPGLGPNQKTFGDSSNLWPVSGTLGSDNEFTTNDFSDNGGFIKVNAWAIAPEVYGRGAGVSEIQPIGIFAHEFGHVLGLPDLYDRTDDNEGPDFNGSEGLGNWCLMAGGSYGGDGQHWATPTHMSAWCKLIMGWVTPRTVEQERQYSINPAEQAGDVLRLWADDHRLSSYFLVENRQQTGFDQYLTGAGLLIYHVDENRWYGKGNTGSGANNDDETHKLVDLEEADGLFDLDNRENGGDAGDPWPGTASNPTFDAGSTPSSRDYAGDPTGVVIENISGSGFPMSAYFRPAIEQGYSLVYDEQGISGWLWGVKNPADYWAGVLFTAGDSGSLEALDIGFQSDSATYKVEIYSSLTSGFGSWTPSGLLASFEGKSATSGWQTVILPEAVKLDGGQDFFVSLLIYNQAYSVSFDRSGESSGRSYTSSNGEYFFDNISTSSSGGDINIRARVRTFNPLAAPLPALSAQEIDFGTVGTGSSASRALQLHNNGDAPLSASISVSGSAEFTVSPSSASVAPGDSQQVSVAFAPTADGSYAGTVTVTGADTSLTVTLSGTAATLALFKNSIGDETFTDTTSGYELWVELNPVISDPLVRFVYTLDGEKISGGVDCVLVNGRWVGSLPAQPLGSTILYYFVVSGGGEIYTLPAGAPQDAYTVTVALSKPGDLDGDWRVSIFDLLELLKRLGGQGDPGAADVDGNGKVDIFDLLELLKMMGRD